MKSVFKLNSENLKWQVLIILGICLFKATNSRITSSDILTQSLNVKKANELDQIIPGVPVWSLNDSQAFPGLSFMPFAGNLSMMFL
ncbi:MAG: hypothetical protein HN778_12940 [Prolixibacteraceae bacterium]|nr:hypothetical protein [Prolixibacteraceae bacterium]MBT6006136.1 hypothetical protein [Prolixibacteraceae bacterium]MBT6765069.1 hypothetical protein [Prolixibacteraceae bacterium]MBT6998553.1 hypothetical protein [Prolixibacteraceae bacterium]MBT7395733.1 hypothetical protein [Prolixibacteraceae bacterium]